MTPTEFLTQNKACKAGRDYAMGFKTMAEVWDNCPRGDWLLWILQKLRITPQRELRLFACWCAEQAKPKDPRSLTAIAVSRRYAMGEATLGELQAASADAAHAAYTAVAAYAAYAAAAEAAAEAADAAADAYAYAYAAYAAAEAAAEAAAAEAADAAAYTAADAYAAAAVAAADAAEAAEAAAAADAYAVADAARAAAAAARQAQASHFRTLVKNPFL